MEQNIKLNINAKQTPPRINTIDVLANAKPITLNTQKKASPSISSKPVINQSTSQSIAIQQQAKPMQAQQAQSIQAKNDTLKSIREMKEAQIKESNVLNNINRVNNTTPNISQNLNKQVSSINQIPTLSQATKSEVELTHNSIKKTSNIEVTHPQEQNIQDTKKQKQDTLKNKNDLENDSTIGRVQDIHIEPNIVKEDLTFRNPNIESLRVNVNQLDFAVTRRVRVYLKKLIDIGGSDLHLKAGAKIRARINGDIIIFSDDIFSKDDAITFAKELTRTRYTEFVSNKEMDMTYIYDVSNRFRVNMFFQMDGVSFAFRTIPTTQNTIDGLGLPKAIHNIVDMERGLVLVTGITGSGKSTTLASIINEINHKHAKHIITIEDPIEFIHKDMKSIINQRSVGMDTNSFASALKAALREDPDIILVGEMRDIETIEMALHAAETGHLVLSTLHTIDSKETINRIVSVFPTHDQTRIRATLASTLNAVVSQRLLKNKDGGRTAAIELLFRTPRIELIINEGRDGEILEALSEGKDIYHTQTFDQHLFELITNGIVDEDMALEKATSSSDLKLKLKNISFAGKNEEGDSITIKR